MSASQMYDYIVVGGGVEGSSTAYQLARRGKRVLLLEQFSLPTTRGSSHGSSRITRRAYANSSVYTQMMMEAYREWADLEKKTGLNLYRKTGLLMCSDDASYLDFVKAGMHKFGCAFTDMTAADINSKYGELFHYPPNFNGVFDPDAGILNADKCLMAFWSEFRRLGGVLQDEEKVLSVRPEEKIVVTDKNCTYKAQDGIILCLGTYAGPFLQKQLGLKLPLTPQKITVTYWKAKDPTLDVQKFPCHIYADSKNRHFYGLPPPEKAGLYKFCNHFGPNADPDERDIVNVTPFVNETREKVKMHLTGLEPEPSIIESCMYTYTPDEHFILDRHPRWQNIVIGAGFSGHGFKMSIVIGKILADLATGITPAYEMEDFSIAKFTKAKL